MSPRFILAPIVVCVTLACSDSSSPAPLTGEVTDPSGDATAHVAQSPAPDIVRGTVVVRDGSATFTVEFAPGTLKVATTFAGIVIDIDDDVNSGDHHANNDLIGIEYSLGMGAGVEGGVELYRFNGITYEAVTLDKSLVVGITTLSTTIPLSVFGDDDGRMAFKGGASAMITPGAYTGALDWLPNPGEQPGRVR